MGDEPHKDHQPVKATAYLHSANSKFMDILKLVCNPSNSTCNNVANLWFNICKFLFHADDGYEVIIEAGYTNPDILQRVIVFEEEAFDESSHEEVPTGKLTLGPNHTMVYQTGDNAQVLSIRRSARYADIFRPSSACRVVHSTPVSPKPTPMKNVETETERTDSPVKFRQVPIFVVECRSRPESAYEFRVPRATDLSRSFGARLESRIQTTLLDYCNHIDTNVGGKTQDQIFCATAIGTQVMFWKKVRQAPQLRKWTGPLELKKDIDKCITEARLFDVLQNGYEFAMEFPGLNLLRGYDGLD